MNREIRIVVNHYMVNLVSNLKYVFKFVSLIEYANYEVMQQLGNDTRMINHFLMSNNYHQITLLQVRDLNTA